MPLVIAIAAFTVIMTWQLGRQLVSRRRAAMEGELRGFVDDLNGEPSRTVVVPGTAIFLNRGRETTPLALRANVEHNHIRHEHVVIVSIDIDTIPRVREEDRVSVDSLGASRDGITHVSIRFGYAETTDVPTVLARLSPEQTEGPIDLAGATYLLSKIELRAGDSPGMAQWRKRLFISTSHITADAAEHVRLPRDRVLLVGSHVEV